MKRIVMLTASAAIVAGGALLPTGAMAAESAQYAGATTTVTGDDDSIATMSSLKRQEAVNAITTWGNEQQDLRRTAERQLDQTEQVEKLRDGKTFEEFGAFFGHDPGAKNELKQESEFLQDAKNSSFKQSGKDEGSLDFGTCAGCSEGPVAPDVR
ncbi:hypothetical protein [Streptomyces bambusae]|uniref:Uncharacterized protein n=1 Tax=Streptomyces bambusae TaxID=1550616 RepID=A0ABS6Z270_9ACTN|nr:hypothetical protein [Streptomyces bambusae]MBW5481841.1 hypothetical protein [Streptomyces bambusae]